MPRCLQLARDDLPVRAWRASVCNWHQKSRTPGFCLSFGFRRGSGCSYGRAVAKIVYALSGYVTLVQYAACPNPRCCCHDKSRKRTQFDSDYSGGDGASTLLSLQVSVYIRPTILNRILLTETSAKSGDTASCLSSRLRTRIEGRLGVGHTKPDVLQQYFGGFFKRR